MRLICPNCDAQYEVPTEVIPTEGRDVQCSNCGQTWFQDHPDTIARREAEAADPAADMDADEEVTRREPESVPPPPQDPVTDPVEDEPVLDVPTMAPDEGPPAATRRSLDPAVADVLREEAELENRARRKEADRMESQPDLGLPDTTGESEKRAREARERMARMRGETVVPDDRQDRTYVQGAESATGSRRDLLPDIEEINSTLRSNTDRGPGGDPGQTAQVEIEDQRSSRRGFILTVALVAILWLIYAFAGDIAAFSPATEPALAAYVQTINDWRLWLDTQISAALTWLDNAATSSNGSE